MHRKAFAVLLSCGCLFLVGGCLDLVCDVSLLETRIRVHDYTNVTLKVCHLLVPEGGRGARLVDYTGSPGLGKGGSERYPLDDTYREGRFLPRPEDHAEYFDRLYFQVWYPNWATFDLGGLYHSVYVALSHDHGPYPEEALEYRLWVSTDGTNFTQLPATTPILVYRRGWSALGENPITGEVLSDAEPAGQAGGNGPWPDVLNDDYTALWLLPEPARFVRITPLSAGGMYSEPEIDAVVGMGLVQHACANVTDHTTNRPTEQGAEFLWECFVVEYRGGRVLLSSSCDGTGEIWVDDAISISVSDTKGYAKTRTIDFSSGCQRPITPLPPLDLSDLFTNGTNFIQIRLFDICGTVVGSSPLFLVLESGGKCTRLEICQDYSVEQALTYAAKYCNKRNSEYEDYASNCANFVTQCLRAGSEKLRHLLSSYRSLVDLEVWVCGQEGIVSKKLARTDDKDSITSCTVLHHFLSVFLPEKGWAVRWETRERGAGVPGWFGPGDVAIVHDPPSPACYGTDGPVKHAVIAVNVDQTKGVLYSANTADECAKPLQALIDRRPYCTYYSLCPVGMQR